MQAVQNNINNMYNNGMQEDTYDFRFTNGIATFIARRLVQVICMTQFSSVLLRPLALGIVNPL